MRFLPVIICGMQLRFEIALMFSFKKTGVRMKRKYLSALLFLSGLILSAGCGENLKEKGSSEYIAEINSWHGKRVENLKKENGWLNLVGLIWLKEGENKFGSDKSNDAVFPEGKAALFMGVITLKDSSVTIDVNGSVEIFSDNAKIKHAELRYDMQGNPTVLRYGSLRWFIIRRGDRFGIRLRDLDADLVKNFPGIDRFPVNDEWRFEAKFQPYNPPKKIAVPNILGMIEESESLGAVVFSKDGKEYKLDVLGEGDSYFIIFADETSGKETYGAGRFLYTDAADSSGKVIVDFNKAYNPPCNFTKYATCPLPPKDNHLKLRITAGEKVFEGGEH